MSELCSYIPTFLRVMRPIRNTSPFLGLHAEATDACTSSRTQKIAWKGDKHAINHTDGHRDSMIESAQWANSMKKGYRRYGLLMCTKTHYTTQCTVIMVPVRATPLLAFIRTEGNHCEPLVPLCIIILQAALPFTQEYLWTEGSSRQRLAPPQQKSYISKGWLATSQCASLEQRDNTHKTPISELYLNNLQFSETLLVSLVYKWSVIEC